MIHTNGSETEVVLLVLLFETLLFVSLRKLCPFWGNNIGGVDIEALWLRTLRAATEGNRIIRADVIIKG